MERRSHLRLAPQAPPPAAGGSRSWALALGALLLCAALAAGALGADRVRGSRPAERLAEEIVVQGLQAGSDSERVRGELRDLRRRVGDRPLHARTRVLYSAVLLEIGSAQGAGPAAAFHARRAANLAPVTVPVVRGAALVLAQCGEAQAAVDLTREMFGYDPPSASGLLEMLEPFLGPDLARSAVPDAPEAWLAWSERLAAAGHAADAQDWLARGRTRFPGNLAIRAALASRALARGDWSTLEEILPPGEPIPPSPESARLFAYRARLRAQRGDASGARADALEAEALGGNALLLVVGDALAAIADLDGARARYSRALYRIPAEPRNRAARISLLLRLARLEERRGRSGEALRRYRAVLEIDPEQPEARGKVAAITGTSPAP